MTCWTLISTLDLCGSGSSFRLHVKDTISFSRIRWKYVGVCVFVGGCVIVGVVYLVGVLDRAR